MKKSSRFWWLHGAILVAAVVGCKSNSSCTSSPYGGGMGQGAPPPVAGTPGLTGSASSTIYNQSAVGGYPGASSMSSGMPGGASGMTGGQSFAPQGGAMYSGPGLSSGAGSH
jgi:hypothetical protein